MVFEHAGHSVDAVVEYDSSARLGKAFFTVRLPDGGVGYLRCFVSVLAAEKHWPGKHVNDAALERGTLEVRRVIDAGGLAAGANLECMVLSGD